MNSLGWTESIESLDKRGRDILVVILSFSSLFSFSLPFFLISTASHSPLAFTFFPDRIQHVMYLPSSAHEWSAFVSLSACLSACLSGRMYTDMCMSARPASGEASKSSSARRTLSTCQNRGCELFPRPVRTLAPSWGYLTGELCSEGSLAPANKHMHMPPLTYSVSSNLHAVMRFFIMWHGKIIFLMYERAWTGFSFKDFVFTSSFC